MSERIKIIHVITVEDSLIFFRGQLAYLRQHGFDFTIACSPGPRLRSFAESEGINYIELPLARSITPSADLMAITQLSSFMRREHFLIAHSHTPKGGLIGTLAARLANIPARIYQLRGAVTLRAHGTTKRLLTLAEHASCSAATRVLAVSHSVQNYALSNHFVDQNKIRVLGCGSGNGVDSRNRFNPTRYTNEHREAIRGRWGIPSDASVLLFVGRLAGDKGLFTLVNAWQRLRTKHSNIYLVVAGTYEQRVPVPEDVKRCLETDSRIKMLGFIPNTQDAYAIADMLLLPTHGEGFPNVVLEANAMGIPVIASNVIGVTDAIVDRETGLLFPLGDSNEMANMVELYLAQESIRRMHGKSARVRVQRDFQPTRIWEQLAAFYRECISSRNSDNCS